MSKFKPPDHLEQKRLWMDARDIFSGKRHEPLDLASERTALNASKELAAYLGISYHTFGDWAALDWTPELVSMLKLIASPYGKILLKAKKIRDEES